MHFLYIFPHPDDESFGPASSISKLIRNNHEVSLLTLTKGGATKVRHSLNLNVQEMGNVRYDEMLKVNSVLGFKTMKVLDLPDSGLKNMDPRVIERTILKEIEVISPDILITYPVHGISGFHDHLVTHAVVKRVYVENKERLGLKRLAFYTLSHNQVQSGDGIHRLHYSNSEEINCNLKLDQKDIDQMTKALDCYKTYKSVIDASIKKFPPFYEAHFEIFAESFQEPIDDLTANFS